MAENINKIILGPLDVPAYSIAEASRLVNMKSWTIKRYLQGYEYDYEDHRTVQPPVIKSYSKRKTYASFLDLIDLIFVREFMKRGFGFPTLRKALDEARTWLNTPHFGRSEFFTTGTNSISLRLPADGKMVELLSGGQWVMTQVIESISDKLDFEEVTKYGFANRWYPNGKEGYIVIDPEVSFGRPIIIDTGIPTYNIYDLYLGEDEKVEPVSNWFNIPPTQIQAAVQFEHSLWN